MNDDVLLHRYLDGVLSTAELALLEQRLRDSATLRDELRVIAEHAVAFADMARGETAERASLRMPDRAGALASTMPWLALASSIAVLAASAWLYLAARPSPVLTLIESSGPVAWSDGVPVQTGESLPAGTVETIGEASAAQFRFGDGTVIALQGEASLTFSEAGQKMLSLSRGTLSAQVKPQPPGHPMLVRTPTAMLNVVGTAFSVAADARHTLLSVDQGLVRTQRLADGSAIEVSAQQRVDVSLDASERLKSQSTSLPPTRWLRSFDQPALPNWRGEWLPANSTDPARVRAVPCVAGRTRERRPVVVLGMTARGSGRPLVTLSPKSVLRLRYRMTTHAPMRAMLTVQKPDGGFGGNFEVRIPADSNHGSTGTWHSLDVAVATFEPLIAKYPVVPAGGQVSLIFITSPNLSAGLEVAKISIEETSP